MVAFDCRDGVESPSEVVAVVAVGDGLPSLFCLLAAGVGVVFFEPGSGSCTAVAGWGFGDVAVEFAAGVVFGAVDVGGFCFEPPGSGKGVEWFEGGGLPVPLFPCSYAPISRFLLYMCAYFLYMCAGFLCKRFYLHVFWVDGCSILRRGVL